MCVDFTNLNKACPNDSFSFPRINTLADSMVDHQNFSFMDAFLGYNQIKMYEPDQKRTTFITDWRLYCYWIMPFSLKNTGATYQRLVNKIFKN